MRALFDVNHPAHVHLFRNAIDALEADGDDVLVTSREKEVTTDLLDAYGIEHVPLSTAGNGLGGLAREWGAREFRMLRAARRFDPDVFVSRLNPAVVHASTLLRRPNIVFNDTDVKSATMDRIYSLATHAFVDVYCTPPGIPTPNARARHLTVDFQELAYLHPNWFTPDPDCLRAHGVDPDAPYSVVRLASWGAYHDVGYSGISPDARRELVDNLADHGRVYVSSEGPLPDDLEAHRLPVPPHLIHHLLAFADLYVGDSGTMSSEAAILGTPAVRTNSMVAEDTESIFHELGEYGLLFSFADESAAVAKVERLLDDLPPDAEWERRRARLLDDKQDVTGVMLGVIGETVRGR